MPEQIISADNYYHRLTASLQSTHPHNTDHRSFWHSSKSLYSPSFFSCIVFVTFLWVLCGAVSYIFFLVERLLQSCATKPGLVNYTYKSPVETAINNYLFSVICSNAWFQLLLFIPFLCLVVASGCKYGIVIVLVQTVLSCLNQRGLVVSKYSAGPLLSSVFLAWGVLILTGYSGQGETR